MSLLSIPRRSAPKHRAPQPGGATSPVADELLTAPELQAMYNLPSMEEADRVRVLPKDLGIARAAGVIIDTYGDSILKVQGVSDPFDRRTRLVKINSDLERAGILAGSPDPQVDMWGEVALKGPDAIVVLEAFDEAVKHEAPSRGNPGSYVGSIASRALVGVGANDTRIALDATIIKG